MKVLNLLGGPCSGKSTTAAGLFYKMKMNHMECEFIDEFAKELVYSDRTHMLSESQDYIFAEQNYRLHRLKDKVGWAITGTSLLLSLVYPPDWYPESFKPFVLDIYNMYNNVNIYLARPEVFQQYGRAHNLDQSKEIDDVVLKVLEQYDIPYFMFQTSETVVDEIYEFLMENYSG